MFKDIIVIANLLSRWLDKLGIAARDGIDVLIRQSFYGGHYSLLDRDTLDPNPVS